MEYKLLHTCIRVLNLDKTIKFYEDALGFKLIRKRDFPKGNFTLAFMSDSTGNHEIELTYNYGRTEPYEIGEGYSHIAVGVSDLEKSWQKHYDMGLEPTESNGRFYFIADPDGYGVEILKKA